jgi:hypothetical protein
MVARATSFQSLTVVSGGDVAAAVSGGDAVAAVEIREEKVFVQLGELEESHDTKIWIVNTGTTNHMTGSRAAFVNLDTRVRGTVRFGDDSAAEIEGHDKVEFLCKNGECQVFEGVCFILKLTTNIVSVGCLDEDGYQILIGGGEQAIREPGGNFLAKVKRTASRLYLLTMTLSARLTMCLTTHEEAETWRWHEQLGHLNIPMLKKMPREELMQGLPDIGSVEHLYEACMAGKRKRASFLTLAQYRADTVLELVHRDLCSKITAPTPAGNNYFLLMVDDKSRYMSITLLPHKDRALEAIQRFQLRAEAETGKKLGGLRTDRGGEFNSASFLDYCLD